MNLDRSLETLEVQLKRFITNTPSELNEEEREVFYRDGHFTIPYLMECAPIARIQGNTEAFACLNGCSDVLYCSEKCRHSAWNQFHSSLCRNNSKLHKLLSYHYQIGEVDHMDHFILVTRMIAMMVSKYTATGAVEHLFDQFTYKPWSTIAYGATDGNEANYLNQKLELLKVFHSRLTDALSEHPSLVNVFTMDYISKLLGIVSLHS
jgi:hypothetical protein